MKKMDLNRNNYEAWLLDLLEERLNAAEVQRLRDFLLLNPDCIAGLDDIEPWVLDSEKVIFAGKSGLRRLFPNDETVLSESGFDLFSIARMEGDLTGAQEIDYQHLLEGDDEKMAEWLIWKEMRLVGETIQFDRKNRLKKRSAPHFRMIWISVASVAAVLMLFFTLFRVDHDVDFSVDLPAVAETDLNLQMRKELPESTGNLPESTGKVSIPQETISKVPALLAGDPVILSIKKHHDPPELTGEKMDTTDRRVVKKELQARPLKVAMFEKDFMKQPDKGSYDRIILIDPSLLPLYSEKRAVEQFSERGLRRIYSKFIEEKDISLVTIASAGIEGINQLTGSDLSLNLSRDEQGEVSGFRFRSNRISVVSPVNKQKNSRKLQPTGR